MVLVTSLFNEHSPNFVKNQFWTMEIGKNLWGWNKSLCVGLVWDQRNYRRKFRAKEQRQILFCFLKKFGFWKKKWKWNFFSLIRTERTSDLNDISPIIFFWLSSQSINLFKDFLGFRPPPIKAKIFDL